MGEGRGSLSVEEERRLIALTQVGNERATGRLLRAAASWVGPIARHYANPRIGAEDLSQVGVVEVWKAIGRFDLSAGVRLRTYAEESVRREIVRVSRMQQLV